MKDGLNKPYYVYSFIAIAVVLFVSTFKINQEKFEFKRTIHADAVGYYSWLPAVFIYNDRNFTFIDTVFSKGKNSTVYNVKLGLTKCSTGKMVNKYTCGVGLSALPFWLISQAQGKVLKKTQGCEEHYQFWWYFSGVFYVLLGIYFFFKMAHSTGQTVLIPLIVSVLLLFGTNLFHYSSFDIGYSQGYTFGWSMAALFCLFKFNQTDIGKYLIRFSFCCGMLFLIRPVNVVLFPVMLFLVLDFKKIKFLFKARWVLLKSILVFFVLAGIYLLSIYWQTGNFLTYMYGTEKFDFTNSHLFLMLFGFQTGAFVYSPVLLVFLISGVVFLFRNLNKWKALCYLFSFLGYVWFISCWETWTYGCTLGNRPLIDFYSILILPFAMVKMEIKWVYKTLLIVASCCFIYINLVLHYQYRVNILDWCNMDKEKFVDVFLKTDDSYIYYCYDDWSFENAKNDSVLQNFSEKDIMRNRKSEASYLNGVLDLNNKQQRNLLFSLDTLKLPKGYRYRLKFSCEALYNEKKGDEMMVVYVHQNREYLNFIRKFVKRKVRKINVWQPFGYEFELLENDKPISIDFSIENKKNSSLEFKNLKATLFQFDK